MTLRLVLVSLVAALGLTIPGGPMLESWVATTQNWMNARFADWDTRNPQEADYVIINDSLRRGARRCPSGSPRDETSPETAGRSEPATTGAKPVPVVSLDRRLDRQQGRRAARLLRPQSRQLHADLDA